MVAAVQTRRAEAQQTDELAAGLERVGDRDAAVDVECRPQLAVDLGDEHLAGRRRGAVEGGEAVQGDGVGLSGGADGERVHEGLLRAWLQ